MASRKKKDLKEEEKGVSPIVAVVLLIAIAVIAAVAIAFWSGGLVTSQSTPDKPNVITATIASASEGKVVVANLGPGDLVIDYLNTTYNASETCNFNGTVTIPEGTHRMCIMRPRAGITHLYSPTTGSTLVEMASTQIATTTYQSALAGAGGLWDDSLTGDLTGLGHGSLYLLAPPGTGLYTHTTALDAGAPSDINVVEWDEDLPVDTGIEVRLYYSNTPDLPIGEPGWELEWLEPIVTNGETDVVSGYQYFTYTAELSSDGAETPTFDNFRIGYEETDGEQPILDVTLNNPAGLNTVTITETCGADPDNVMEFTGLGGVEFWATTIDYTPGCTYVTVGTDAADAAIPTDYEWTDGMHPLAPGDPEITYPNGICGDGEDELNYPDDCCGGISGMVSEITGFCHLDCGCDPACMDQPDEGLVCNGDLVLACCAGGEPVEDCVNDYQPPRTCVDGECIEGPDNNDMCADATAAIDGENAVDNTEATTDGIEDDGLCLFFGSNQLYNDVWFDYTSTCTGTLTVDTCTEGFDTKLAIYEDCNCDPEPITVVACNDDDCGLQSTITAPVTMGNCYKIRVGGYNEEQRGTATMTIACEAELCVVDASCDGPGGETEANCAEDCCVGPVSALTGNCHTDCAAIAECQDIAETTEVCYNNDVGMCCDGATSVDCSVACIDPVGSPGQQYAGTCAAAACDINDVTDTENDEALCINGEDDDCDNEIDCNDANCVGAFPEAICGDGEDGDCDTDIDCLDADCEGGSCGENGELCTAGVCLCLGGVGNEDPESTCTGGIDEDCDGNADCADDDCSGDPACQVPVGGICLDTLCTEPDPNVMLGNGGLCGVVATECIAATCDVSGYEFCPDGWHCGQESNFNGCDTEADFGIFGAAVIDSGEAPQVLPNCLSACTFDGATCLIACLPNTVYGAECVDAGGGLYTCNCIC
ncbi:archaellin/type IV pilin N-terminal domain-containing protein [archaeon]